MNLNLFEIYGIIGKNVKECAVHGNKIGSGYNESYHVYAFGFGLGLWQLKCQFGVTGVCSG